VNYFSQRIDLSNRQNRYVGHGWTMMHGHFLIMGGFTLVHADINMPKKPTKPKLSLSFRFWRNAVDKEQGSRVRKGGPYDEEQAHIVEFHSEQNSERSVTTPSVRRRELRSVQDDDRSSNDTEPRIHPNSQRMSYTPAPRPTVIAMQPPPMPYFYGAPPPLSPGAMPQFYPPQPSPRVMPQFHGIPSPSSPGPMPQFYPIIPPSPVSSIPSYRLPPYRDENAIPEVWTQRDEEQCQGSEEEKQHYEKAKQKYETDKQRYEAEHQNYVEEKQRHDDEKRHYEESQRGSEDRRKYEISRQKLELVRQAYEEERYLYEESRRLYQETRERYWLFRYSSREIKRCYGEIRKRGNGVEMQRVYEEANTLYQEQTKRHDKERKMYDDVKWRHKEARQSYEEARKRSNNTKLRNRGGRRHGPMLDEGEDSNDDYERGESSNFGETKRRYVEENERYEKARGRYKKESQVYDEATERHEAATARYTQDFEGWIEEANQCYQQEERQYQAEKRQYEEEKQRYAEEREHYEEARQQYEDERGVYEGERMASAAVQHKGEEDERRRYETERQQYEDRRLQFENELCSEEQKLRRYETELQLYEQKVKEYETKCQHYQLGPLSFDRFQRLVHESKIDFPKITMEEIQDKSKADFLSKVIAILQTTWFLFQCVARGGQGLAITELELVTLALASLNAATYACWWNKPLGVQDPARVYLKIDVDETQVTPVLERVHRVPEATITRVLDTIRRLLATSTKRFLDTLGLPFAGGGSLCGHYFLLIWVPCFLVFLIALIFIIFLSLFPLSIAVLLKVIKPTPPSEPERSPTTRQLIATRIMFALRSYHYELISVIGNFFQDGFSGVWNNLFSFFIGLFIIFPLFFLILVVFLVLLLPFFTLSFVVSFLFTSVFGIITTNTINPGATQVPSFYACKTDSDRYSRMIVFAFFGVIFGGLHCIGWNFSYPTSYERTLWRVASLLITLIPVIVAPIDYLLANMKEDPKRSLFTSLGLSFLDLAMTIFLFTYVPARLSLIAQAFALLRIQPESTFIPVDWTQYIPHILTP